MEVDQGSLNEVPQSKSLRDLGFGSFENKDLEPFFKIERNYLIMTTAGKPVFAL